MIIDKIIIKNLEFSYDFPYKTIFEGLNLEIDKNWKTVLTGKNGRGKTTLLKLIGGEIPNYNGEIISKGTFSYFPYEVNDESLEVRTLLKDLAGNFFQMERLIEKYLREDSEGALIKYGEVEEIYRNSGGYEIEAIIEKEILDIGLSLDILDKKYQVLSGGEKTKIKLIALFLQKDKFPLIDEPTNHLDIYGRGIVAKYLKGKNKGFICVSHDENFLNEIGDHIINIHSRRGIEVKKAEFSNFRNEKKLEEEKEFEKNENLKREIKKKTESFREKCDWSFEAEEKKSGAYDKGFMGAKAARLMQRAKNLEKRLLKDIDDKKSLVENFEKNYEIKFFQSNTKAQVFLKIDKLNISFEGKNIVENFSLDLLKGERIALIGPNGCGKSSVIKKIIENFYSSQIKISYIEQEIFYENEILKDYLLKQNIELSEFGRFLASFDMRGEVLYRNLLEFSQGEKRKIALALSIYSKADFYIWDEPLNFLDLDLIEKMEEAILRDKPTMIFVEHDRNFVEKVATRILEMG